MENTQSQTNHNAKISIITAGISVVAWIIPIIGIPLSIVALVFGFRAKRDMLAKIAIGLAILTLVAGVINAGVGAKRGYQKAQHVESSQQSR